MDLNCIWYGVCVVVVVLPNSLRIIAENALAVGILEEVLGNTGIQLIYYDCKQIEWLCVCSMLARC